MPVLVKRTRIVSFRLSEQEYLSLQRLSEENGAHSISDYARSLACGAAGYPPALHSEVQSLNGRVEELTRELARISELVSR